MQIDIAAHIEKLLFLHESLVIPGFGGFTATRTPAVADYVGGTVSPPAKTLTFSENLTVDDGILVDDLTQSAGIQADEARELIAAFVEKTRQLLDQREIVTLPGVGRLYKNYMQKIQFLPDSSNFNTASYGLPPLQFSPIARSREVEKASETSTGTSTTSSTSQPPNNTTEPLSSLPLPPTPSVNTAKDRSGGWGPALAILFLLAAIAFGVWFWKNRNHQKAIADKADIEKTVEAVKKEEVTPSNNDETPSTVQEALEQSAAESANEKMKTAREQLKARKCILVVATLQDQNNAERLQEMLRNANYDVYYLEKSGYQVGIQFDYTDPSDVQKNVRELQKLTGEKQIWVKKK
jgi:cell division septation protein DedD